MISRRTSSIPKQDVFPRLLYSDSTSSQVLPGAPEGHYITPVNSDQSPGWRVACKSPSEGTRFRQSRQSRPEHPGVSDGNSSCCWCTFLACLTVRSQVSSQDAPNRTRWHTPSLLNCTLPTMLSRRSPLHSMTYSQPAWLYVPKFALKTLPITLDGTLPACLTVCSQVSSQDSLKHTPEHAFKYTPNSTRWHSQPTWLYAPKYTLKRQDTPNLSWLYAPMYAPVCSIQRLAELQAPGTRRREAGGGRRVAGGGWLAVYGGWNHVVGRYHSLNLIIDMATVTKSHDASSSWCWQLQP